MTIVGSAFRNGVTVSLVNRTINIPGIISNRTTTKILCTFPLNATPAGLYNLTIQNIDGTSAIKLNAFTINPADKRPTIQNLTPESGVNNVAQSVIINGTNFRKGVTVTITNRSITENSSRNGSKYFTTQMLPPAGRSSDRALQPDDQEH